MTRKKPVKSFAGKKHRHLIIVEINISSVGTSSFTLVKSSLVHFNVSSYKRFRNGNQTNTDFSRVCYLDSVTRGLLVRLT